MVQSLEDPLELLDAEQVGVLLKRHPRTVIDLARKGKLSVVRIGPRGVRFTREDVRSYIESCRTEP